MFPLLIMLFRPTVKLLYKFQSINFNISVVLFSINRTSMYTYITFNNLAVIFYLIFSKSTFDLQTKVHHTWRKVFQI